jgi:bifunctional pyridoxal-dependent enzyme with beta-cystathionase and maltose regulon repressor activities
MFSSGVVPAISSMVRRLTQPAEKAVVEQLMKQVTIKKLEEN